MHPLITLAMTLATTACSVGELGYSRDQAIDYSIHRHKAEIIRLVPNDQTAFAVGQSAHNLTETICPGVLK